MSMVQKFKSFMRTLTGTQTVPAKQQDAHVQKFEDEAARNSSMVCESDYLYQGAPADAPTYPQAASRGSAMMIPQPIG